MTYAYIVFGLAAGLLLSATFLADYARTAASERAYLAFRRQALWAGPVAIAAAVSALFVAPSPAWLQGRLASEWPWFAASLAAFLVAVSAWYWPRAHAASPGRPRGAVLFTALQFGLAAIGYGIAHAPYLLYPTVATAPAFTGKATFTAILAISVLGASAGARGHLAVAAVRRRSTLHAVLSAAGPGEDGSRDGQPACAACGQRPLPRAVPSVPGSGGRPTAIRARPPLPRAAAGPAADAAC